MSGIFDPGSGHLEVLRHHVEKYDRFKGKTAAGSGLFSTAVAPGAAPTLVVAASDSLQSSKDRADLICTGTGDQVEIQAAVTLLATTGGRIILTEGTYDIAAVVVLGSADFHIQGVGSPVLTLTASGFTSAGDYVRYSGMTFTGSASGSEILKNTSATGLFITDGCTFTSLTTRVCIRMFHAGGGGSHFFYVEGCKFDTITLAGGGGGSPNGIIWGDDGSAGNRHGLITGSLFKDITGAVADTNGGPAFIGMGNTFINSTGKREGIWSHNMIDGVNEAGDHSGTAPTLSRSVEFSDQRTTLTTGSGNQKWVAPLALTIVDVQLAIGTSPTGTSLIVDVHKNTVTIFTTQGNRPTVPAGDADGIGAATAPDVTAMAAGEYLTVDIDQIGSTVAGGELTVVIEWRPT